MRSPCLATPSAERLSTATVITKREMNTDRSMCHLWTQAFPNDSLREAERNKNTIKHDKY